MNSVANIDNDTHHMSPYYMEEDKSVEKSVTECDMIKFWDNMNWEIVDSIKTLRNGERTKV